jgi:hypothetical protein
MGLIAEVEMVPASGLKWLNHGAGRKVLAAMLAFQSVALFVVIAAERAAQRADLAQMPFNLKPDVLWRNNVAGPTVRPPILKASVAKMDPHEVVIGVEVGGNVRAYRLAAFDDASGHLVNDLLGGVPVSVAYCNLSRCVRVYTDPKASAPLDAEILGLLNDQTVIRLGGNLYFQLTGEPVEPDKSPPELPFSLLTPSVTSWQEWSRRHPESDVYVGGRRSVPH